MKLLVKIILVPPLLLAWLWSLGAFYYLGGGASSSIALLAALGFIAGTVISLWRFRSRGLWWVPTGFLIALAWFFSVQPSHDRDWRPEYSRIASAEFQGDTVTVRNIRNFHYRSADDFDVEYYDKTYDLTELDTADLVMCYWDGNTAIAHTMLSFGFGGEDYLCLSVETRRAEGQAWGGLPGIYRQFEVIYILGDERDLINLRTSYRGEDVYLYRLNVPPTEIRQYFELTLRDINALNDQPEFYNTWDYNCSSALQRVSKELWPERPRTTGTRGLLNGYTDADAYARGRVADYLPFEELKKKSYISRLGHELRYEPDFSRKVRAALPPLESPEPPGGQQEAANPGAQQAVAQNQQGVDSFRKAAAPAWKAAATRWNRRTR